MYADKSYQLHSQNIVKLRKLQRNNSKRKYQNTSLLIYRELGDLERTYKTKKVKVDSLTEELTPSPTAKIREYCDTKRKILKIIDAKYRCQFTSQLITVTARKSNDI